jgi:hypothetical protein
MSVMGDYYTGFLWGVWSIPALPGTVYMRFLKRNFATVLNREQPKFGNSSNWERYRSEKMV